MGSFCGLISLCKDTSSRVLPVRLYKYVKNNEVDVYDISTLFRLALNYRSYSAVTAMVLGGYECESSDIGYIDDEELTECFEVIMSSYICGNRNIGNITDLVIGHDSPALMEVIINEKTTAKFLTTCAVSAIEKDSVGVLRCVLDHDTATPLDIKLVCDFACRNRMGTDGDHMCFDIINKEYSGEVARVLARYEYTLNNGMGGRPPGHSLTYTTINSCNALGEQCDVT